MKRLTLWVLTAVLALVPLPVFAMDTLSDTDMGAVTGQAGVSITYFDISLDLQIANIAWSDSDCGTLIVSTVPVSYGPGYINIHDIEMKNIYFTMDTDAAGITSDANGTFLQSSAHPITIDVMTGSTNARLNPFCATRGMTGVAIGLSDYYGAIQNLSIRGIYLDDHAYTVQTATYLSTEKWDFTTGPMDKAKSLGGLIFSGVEMTQHAYVGGYETANLTAGQSIHPINPNHRGLILIGPH